MVNQIVKFFLENRLVTFLIVALIVAWGITTSPFGWDTQILPKDPVPVDAIPDIGENQQIVFTEWPGRSPQDIEDQITYPLTTTLLGLPGVKSVRSNSMFGFSSIYIIFEEDIDFYWSRSRILEKLNSLPEGTLPKGIQPTLGPDATGLGQIFWYTLEGRDKDGNPTGGWDLAELRSIQDFYVKYGLSSVQGVSEVSSVGGFVREYQIDLQPEAMRSYDISLNDVVKAVSESNLDVGAKTMEINRVEYFVRGLGYVKNLEDLEETVVASRGYTPVRLKDIAWINFGPATRRGVLDKNGDEAVGGVVVARYGANPMEVIQSVKDKIADLKGGLPSKKLADGTTSQVTIVPFYDRSSLIRETLGTLQDALTLEIIITIIVILVMVANLRGSILISLLLPLGVLMVFIAMRYTGVDANIVALSGIAIAIGTMVDLGIILTENIIKYMDEREDKAPLLPIIYQASAEVSGAILTAVSTTIVSFIPVFTLQEAEGKLFRPLAFTKTYALVAAVLVALFVLPAAARTLYGLKLDNRKVRWILNGVLALVSIYVMANMDLFTGIILLLLAISWLWESIKGLTGIWKWTPMSILLILITWILSITWLPLGPNPVEFLNFLFVALVITVILGAFQLLIRHYGKILGWALENRKTFLSIPLTMMVLGLTIGLGFSTIFGGVARGFDLVGVNVRTTWVWSSLAHHFPGIGSEFMPSLDEGSFLLMPTSMPHAGIEQNQEVLRILDRSVEAIPEVDMVVGKMGRVESALDPAPISMYENIISYKPEYISDLDGSPLRFRVVKDGRYITSSGDTLSGDELRSRDVVREDLIEDQNGEYFRNWRDEIREPDDIWKRIAAATNIPGVTSAPKLQPIETRLVMLQTGMRAPMGIKVFGHDLDTIQKVGMEFEKVLKEVPTVKKEAVFADRIVGKPYLELEIDRKKASRYGLSVQRIQQAIETAIGGIPVTQTVEGRERYAIRVRYPRGLRDTPEDLKEILISTPDGVQIPIGEVVSIKYEKGPQSIKSENGFLVGYVLFDKVGGVSEVDVVNAARKRIEQAIEQGEIRLPAGISYKFSGSYENQVRASKRLSVVIPVVFMVIFLILYLQFRSVAVSSMVFSAVAVAFSGGFIMLWLYGHPTWWDWSLGGLSIGEVFNIQTIYLSVAVWVGFIALFGIATDDGVVIATYLDQQFERSTPSNVSEVRENVLAAGLRRVRPCLMTTATTLIALLPVLSSQGRGSDIMIPMAIPAFGGMVFEVITLFVVPVLYSIWYERKHLRS